MKLNIARFSGSIPRSDLLFIPLFQQSSKKKIPDKLRFAAEIKNVATDALNQGDFGAKEGEIYWLPVPEFKARRIVFLGLGESKNFNPGKLNLLAYSIHTCLKKAKGKQAHLLNLEASKFGESHYPLLAELILMSRYKFERYKSTKERDNITFRQFTFLHPGEFVKKELSKNLANAKIAAESVAMARDLANQPGNELTPKTFVNQVRRLLKNRHSIQLEILDRKKIRQENMGALSGVAAGSTNPPFVVIMKYRATGKNAKTLAVIGKGITFDSGGISIKSPLNMWEMKYDMCGGAAVAGLMNLVAELQPKLNVIGVIPLAENMPGGAALKPGDIVTACNGKTIEVIDTDAEGRLVLADALAYTVKQYKPDWLIDLATLTGTVVRALADKASGLFSNDEALRELLTYCGEESNERVWPLPLWDDYQKQIESDVADIKNLGSRWGGAVTAAKFLEAFVDNTPWAHLDIAGTAFDIKDNPVFGKGPTGVGVRLLSKVIQELQKK